MNPSTIQNFNVQLYLGTMYSGMPLRRDAFGKNSTTYEFGRIYCLKVERSSTLRNWVAYFTYYGWPSWSQRCDPVWVTK